MSRQSYTVSKINQAYISDEAVGETNGKLRSNGHTHESQIWMTSDNGGRSSNGTSSPVHVHMDSPRKEGSTLSIHDISYTVKVKTKPFCGDVTERQILKNINAAFKPGMNAILGPTGSGKSSLLDILAGRKDPSGLQGTLLLDGCPTPENFKCMVGYVVQDDVVMGTLSVRENFQFSAALRLPDDVSVEEREERVNTVIEELGLTACADTKVGSEFIRGVSGGERKRCNIGMELIISPPVLFLDEPTTGLDANTANTVMSLLKRLSMRGRTIIFSIHQPRYSIYRLFDTLFLLSKGETVYNGPASEALDFFNGLGYPCQEHNNPPDFFLDVINGDLNMAIHLETSDDPKSEAETHNKLITGYRSSHWYTRATDELAPIIEEHEQRVRDHNVHRMPRVEYATSFVSQLGHVCLRTLKNLLRNPQVSILQVIIMVVFGLVVGAIYWDVDNSCKFGIQNRAGVLFFVIMDMVFANLSAVELFIRERAIFMHENVSGFYRVSAYFMAKVICDIIPMRLFPTTLFAVITYWMIGFKPDAGNFFVYVFGLCMVSLAASSISFWISALVKIFAIANIIIALTYVVMMVFSGLLVNIESIPAFLQWIKYISIFRYTMQALQINELKDMVFENCTTGNEYLQQQGIPYETGWDLWVNFLALAVFSVIFMALTQVRLLTMNKLR